MKRRFTASVWLEDSWFVAQCLEVDVASQGESEQEAVKNLTKALQLYFQDPSVSVPTTKVLSIEVEVGAA